MTTVTGGDDPLDAEREARFVALYHRHYGDVLRYARRRIGEPHDRDVTAETFTVAWRRLDEASARGLPWLYRTAQLTIRNWQRTEQRAARTLQHLVQQPPGPGPVDPAVAHVSRDAVVRALLTLSEADRELLLLVTWEGLEVRAAAEVVGCTPATAAVRLFRARARLRPILLPDPAIDATGRTQLGGAT